MWDPERKNFIDSHNFFVSQAKKRVLSQFDNIEDEVKDREKEWLGSLDHDSYSESYDIADLYEWIHQQSLEQSFMLYELRHQMLLSIVAGMYHQWDKQLRVWLEREAREWGYNVVNSEIWKKDIGCIYELFKYCEWDVESEEFFQKLDACRLVVNVHKHGKGVSLDNLKKNYVEYFCGDGENNDLDHTLLFLDDSHLEEFSDAIIKFWEVIPERMEESEHKTPPSWILKAINKENK